MYKRIAIDLSALTALPSHESAEAIAAQILYDCSQNRLDDARSICQYLTETPERQALMQQVQTLVGQRLSSYFKPSENIPILLDHFLCIEPPAPPRIVVGISIPRGTSEFKAALKQALPRHTDQQITDFVARSDCHFSTDPYYGGTVEQYALGVLFGISQTTDVENPKDDFAFIARLQKEIPLIIHTYSKKSTPIAGLTMSASGNHFDYQKSTGEHVDVPKDGNCFFVALHHLIAEKLDTDCFAQLKGLTPQELRYVCAIAVATCGSDEDIKTTFGAPQGVTTPQSDL